MFEIRSTATAETSLSKDSQEIKSLDLSWFPLAAEAYCISKDLNDYFFVSTLICPSDLPNRNGIAFPLEELIRFMPPPNNRMAYKGWAGAPVFYNHCFTKETLISTPTGLKQIAKIKVGDEVYTRSKRVKKVTRIFKNRDKETYMIDALGLIQPLCVTGNHPLWVVDSRQLKYSPEIAKKVISAKIELKEDGKYKNSHDPMIALKKKTGLTTSEINSCSCIKSSSRTYLIDSDIKLHPHYRPVTDVYPGDYLVSPILIGGNVSVDEDLAFLLGAYTAEGNICPSGKAPYEKLEGVCLTINYAETNFESRIKECCDNLGYLCKSFRNKSTNTCTIRIYSRKFAQFCYDNIGCYSFKKQLKGEVRTWDKDGILNFLAGYISGDGCLKGQRLKCSTTSVNLALDLQHAFGFIGAPATANGSENWPSVYTDKRYLRYFRLFDETSIKRNGELRKNKGGKPSRGIYNFYEVGCSFHVMPEELFNKIKKQYSFNFRQVKHKELGPRILVRSGYLLFPIATKIINPKRETVYNLEVEEEHNYIANSVVAHNCNEDPTKAHGVILDVSLRRIQGYNGNRLCKVTGILAIDKTKYPEIAEKVMSGEINTYSMGAEAYYFTCSYCGEICDDKHCCSHISSINDVNFRTVKDYEGNTHLVFLNAHALSPIETSIVPDPAWAPAQSDNIIL